MYYKDEMLKIACLAVVFGVMFSLAVVSLIS